MQFIVHYNPFEPGKPPSYIKRRGFTAVIQSTDDPKRVRVFYSFCSKKDQFNKKKGVKTALSHGSINVSPKALPKFLGGLAQAVHPRYNMHGYFDYVLKRFV